MTAVGKILAPTNVARIERQYQVLELRKQGFTLVQIAESLGISPSTARDDVESVLNRTIKELGETAAEHRQLELERYDSLLQFYFPLAASGNLAAAALVLNISQQRRKLLALDIPEVKRLEVSGIREYVGVNVEAV